MEAIEHWPWEARGTPPIETIVSGDGTTRLHFIRRPNGTVQFFTQDLTKMETMGQEYWGWYPSAMSGVYPDLAAAKKDAKGQIAWFGTAL